MASEQFSLCWDNFHKNMSSGMNTLLENEDLVDVTLAVEGRCLKAHKMVLSVCSPYFKELFKSNPCQHPIVFMKDVSYVALSDLLQFMYQGEVQVSQENLSTFIKTAEALQIKGLTGDGNGTNDTESESFTERSQPEEYKPIQRPKKQPASQITPSPALHSAKRMRVNYSNESQASPSSNIITKPEPPHQSSPAAVIGGSGTSSGAVSAAAGASAPGSSSVSDMIQFKMEPYDHSQNIISVDEAGGDDTFDENLDDTNVDETEDYSMVEGNEDEPQAGTSADGAGDGQARLYFTKAKGKTLPRLILNKNAYFITNRTNSGGRTYWRCIMHDKAFCKARMITHGNLVEIIDESHTHLPTESNLNGLSSRLFSVTRRHYSRRRYAHYYNIKQ